MFSKIAGSKITTLNDIITFGKYKDKTVRQVLNTDAQYIKWLIENTDKTCLPMKDIQLVLDRSEDEHHNWLIDEYSWEDDHY